MSQAGRARGPAVAEVARQRFGADGWPHPEASAFVMADGRRFHIQRWGEAGPLWLLIHGTAASTHSWRDAAPLLAAQGCRVLAVDLPGHGLSDPVRGAPTVARVADAVTAILKAADAAPDIVVGHSAGAAVAVRMTLDGGVAPDLVISLNGALRPFGGWAGQMFSGLAKALFLNPLTPRWFAWRAQARREVERVLEGTGSRLSDEGVDYYARLFRDHRHVGEVLAMMAHWDLEPLQREWRALETPLALLVGERDRAVPAADAAFVRDRAPHATLTAMPGLGHLAHEEAPAQVCALMLAAASALRPGDADGAG